MNPAAHLDAFSVAVLLLKCDKPLVDSIRLALRNVIQGILVDGPRAVNLLTFLLKLCELDEELLLQGREMNA